jgi:hypothetical protein
MRLLDNLMNLPTLTCCGPIFMELVKASLQGAEPGNLFRPQQCLAL